MISKTKLKRTTITRIISAAKKVHRIYSSGLKRYNMEGHSEEIEELLKQLGCINQNHRFKLYEDVSKSVLDETKGINTNFINSTYTIRYLKMHYKAFMRNKFYSHREQLRFVYDTVFNKLHADRALKSHEKYHLFMEALAAELNEPNFKQAISDIDFDLEFGQIFMEYDLMRYNIAMRDKQIKERKEWANEFLELRQQAQDIIIKLQDLLVHHFGSSNPGMVRAISWELKTVRL